MRESLEQYCLNHGKTELLAEWDAEKNGAATPQNTPHSSREKAWWRCENGHSWQARIQSRVLTGCGCPVCKGQIIQPGFNDLQTRRPDIAAEWDTEKNAPLRPDAIAVSSNRLVWWRCEHGHVWLTAVFNRVHGGTGCPVCRMKKKGRYRDIPLENSADPAQKSTAPAPPAGAAASHRKQQRRNK